MTNPVRYIELKTGYSGNGPAWIARVSFSKSGRTIYFNDRALHRIARGGISANFMDIESREEFWISAVKRRGTNRHLSNNAPILIERSARDLLEKDPHYKQLNFHSFETIEDFPMNSPERFHQIENLRL